MRSKIISFLKKHPKLLAFLWATMSVLLKIWSVFLPINKKRIVFASFGGRSFNDSPKALYDEICTNPFFGDWELVWAFAKPKEFELPRGRTIRIDSFSFFRILLSSRVWVSNSGMSRGISIHRKKIIEVETWHGTPLKKIGGEENMNSLSPNRNKKGNRKLDSSTIRCAQSEYDQEIFARIFHSDKKAIDICDLPRNDELTKYTSTKIYEIKKRIGIPLTKKVILYTPTYREYLSNKETIEKIKENIDIKKWKTELGDNYVVIIRAHYTFTEAMRISEEGFVFDLTNYPNINDLYAVSDLMISDYSSTFVDYSIMSKPMLCFAYDLEEYQEKRGLYCSLEAFLPCPIDTCQESLINRIKTMDYQLFSKKTKEFSEKYAPFAGKATKSVIKRIIERCQN